MLRKTHKNLIDIRMQYLKFENERKERDSV